MDQDEVKNARGLRLLFSQILQKKTSLKSNEKKLEIVIKQELNSSVTSCDKARRGGKIH
jgi:hypothetical protein